MIYLNAGAMRTSLKAVIQMLWEYEPDEQPKRKHRWEHPRAGFDSIGTDKFIGKCPSNISVPEAQLLLRDAIPWSPASWRPGYPKRLYAVRDGVLYRATPTNPGTSYHGFPEHPTRFPAGARELKQALIRVASTQGCEEGLRRWMNW